MLHKPMPAGAESSFHQILQFAMQGGARRSARISRIGSSQNWNLCSCEWENSVHCDHTFPFTAVIDVALKLFHVSRQNIRSEFGVVQNSSARALIAHAFQNA